MNALLFQALGADHERCISFYLLFRILGTDTSFSGSKVQHQKARWEAALMEKQVAMAIAAACVPIAARAWRVLSATANTGLFHAGAVLVGWYALVAIGNMLGVSWRRETALTLDIDLAASDAAMIAIPANVKPLDAVILGSDRGLLNVPMMDPRNPSTSFKIQGQEFRVDLITPQDGKSTPVQFVKAIKS